MKQLVAIFRELTGLFIDDGMLALEIVGVVLIAGISEYLIPDARLMGGGILLFGCLFVLFVNVLKSGRS